MMKLSMLLMTASFPVAFMSDAVPVVVIVTENGPVRINKTDYDPTKHTLHEGEEAPAVIQPEQNGGDGSQQQLMVMKDGKKFTVTDAAGAKIIRDGIDDKGYATEQEAWNAILALPKL